MRSVNSGESLAFSLIELLIVIAVIAVLAILVLRTQAAVTERARAAQCIANLRTIGVALMSYAGDHNGQFPPTSGFPKAEWVQAGWSEFLQIGGYLENSAAVFCPSIPPRNAKGINLRDKHPVLPGYSYGHFTYGLRSDHPGKIPPPHTTWNGSWENYNYDGKESAPIQLRSVPEPAKSILVTDAYAVGYGFEASAYRYDEGSAGWAGAHFRHFDKLNALFADGHVSSIDRTEMADFLERENRNAAFWNGESFEMIRSDP